MQGTLTITAVSALIMFVSLPLIFRKVPKNMFYGLRTRKTMSGSDEYWYQANQRAGFYMLVAGAFSFLASLLLPLFYANPRSQLRVAGLIMVPSVMTAFVVSMVRERTD